MGDLSVSYQIVLTISQTMWCRDITNCLATEGDVLEAMKDAEEKSFQVWFLVRFLSRRVGSVALSPVWEALIGTRFSTDISTHLLEEPLALGSYLIYSSVSTFQVLYYKSFTGNNEEKKREGLRCTKK